jgi:hypothetical protein
VVALCTVTTLSACGAGGPSIRAEPDDSTTTSSEPEPTTSTTIGEPTTSTTAPVDGQVVEYQGLRFVVPTDWPVYDLAAAPRRCVRVDAHAVYLGKPGLKQDCPAHPVGNVETVLVVPLATASPYAVGRATTVTTLNGMPVRLDPDPDHIGVLTVVLPDLGLVAFLNYGESDALAQQLVSGFTLAAP